MINDMDTQQIYGIMNMEEIERLFSQIERRIGVHERDVIVLEERCKGGDLNVTPFNVWWIEGSRMQGAAELSCADEVGRAYLARLEMEQKQYQAEAPGIVGEDTGGEDEADRNRLPTKNANSTR